MVQSLLKVEVIATPDDFMLEESDDGAVPSDVAVQVKVTNLTDPPVPIQNVTVPNELDISLFEPDPGGPGQKYLVPKTAPEEPVVFDRIEPGDTNAQTVDFTLEAQDDGHYVVESLVSFQDPLRHRDTERAREHRREDRSRGVALLRGRRRVGRAPQRPARGG
ncbi:MAG: hypothetical protein M5U31_09765 [Acidimicrobiia bacterium]|nr:hypothetical protein [Acidimicrobiia bacterium]